MRVADDASVCEAFAREGWCDEEAGTCPELHIWECPEWHAKGTCARGTRCGLRHILRREKTQAAADAASKATQQPQAQGGFEDQSEFIGLPGEVVSETSDSEEDDDEDDEGSEDDDESEDEDDESMAVDETSGKDKNAPSSPGMDSDDDDELRVMGEV